MRVSIVEVGVTNNQVAMWLHIGSQEQPGGPLPNLQKLGHCDLLSRNQLTH